MLPAVCRPQDVKLFLSDKPADPKEKDQIRAPRLKPNATQDLYLYVESTDGQKSKVTVQAMAGDKPIDGAVKEIELTGKGAQRVDFSPAKAAEKPAKPVPPPEVAGGSLSFVVLNKDGKTLGDPMVITVGRPREYVEADPGDFDPSSRRLSVKVGAGPTFIGPRSRVELDLGPARMPFLPPNQKQVGSYGGYLNRPEDRLNLTAEALTVRPINDPGLFSVTVDGYQRAFTYRISREGGTPTNLRDATIRLVADPTAASGPAAKVGIEADNIPDGAVIELGLYRDAKFNELDGELLTFKGDRQQRLFFNPAGPGGALTFKSEVSDWTTGLETAKIFGERLLRLQLVDEKSKEPLEFILVDAKGRIQVDAKGQPRKVKAITSAMLLDGSPPEGIEFVDFPKELARGSALTLKATGSDPESGISKVVFFAGKLPPDGIIPPMAIQAPGEKKEDKDKKDIWVADLPMATDKAATIEVGVQFTNGVGLTETKTAVIKLVDAKPGAAKIKGAVVEGDQAQAELEVLLRDPMGTVKDTVKTDKDGKFLFKDVAPGTYQLVVVKTSSKRMGTAVVKVEAGEEKELKEAIKLVR
jgi:hypothetical protein